jgi:hypothetical protein
MLRISSKPSLAVLAAIGGLALAASAGAGHDQPGLVLYNGHAGLGASLYEHNQTDPEFLVTASWRPRAASDGTSNTLMT